MHSRYAGSASAIRIATATPNCAFAAPAARPQTRGASGGECRAIVDDVRATLPEQRVVSKADRVPQREALQAITLNSSYELHQDRDLGSLEVREGTGGAMPLTDRDRREIKKQMGRILGSGTATFASCSRRWHPDGVRPPVPMSEK